MKHKTAIIIVFTIALATIGGSYWHRQRESCKARNDALIQRVEDIERSAAKKLPHGAARDDAVRFLRELGAEPFDVGTNEVHGTLYTSGCSPFGCGSDSALIGITIKFNSAGQVEGTNAMAMYTDCV